MRNKVHKLNLKIQDIYSWISMHSNEFINMAHNKYWYEANWGLWLSKCF
jgi:hypothetical protein